MTAQHMTALAKANQTRSRHAKVRRQVRDLEVNVIDAIRDPSCASMQVFDMLSALPRFGPGRVGRILRALAIAPNRRCGDLTERQIRAIRNELLDSGLGARFLNVAA